MNATLFDEVVNATGLNPKIAPFVVRRVCASIGFPALSMTQAQLSSAVGAFGAAIRVYKTDPEADAAVERIRLLAASGPPTAPAHSGL